MFHLKEYGSFTPLISELEYKQIFGLRGSLNIMMMVVYVITC